MTDTIHLLPDATQRLIDTIAQLERNATPFQSAQAIMPYLGAQPVDEGARIGFWTPELIDNNIDMETVFLEVLRPDKTIDFSQREQVIRFTRTLVPLVQHGDYLWGIVAGMIPGTRQQTGDFYRVIYTDPDGVQQFIPDYLAASIPFGSFAPAEYYDMAGMLANRADAAHFDSLHIAPEHQQDGIDRIAPPTNILQIHARYASPEGSLAGLTRLYNRIAEKIRRGDDLTPAEQNFVGYDAIQLMPVEPTIEYEGERVFWAEIPDDSSETSVVIRVQRPDMTNWGYDVVISASTATNPALLETGRPDELLDLIVALHNFPGKPIKVMLDIVYGHIDNQALDLLNGHFSAGANMYGQNINFLHPVTRAMLLEMMRRKHNYGVDGIRVDGAQDFKNWNPKTQTMDHDDDYLHLMNDIVLEVAGRQYRPWMIFEDGRPWPRDDWELSSSYRVVTELMPNVWQWGPLTFAHNTPFLFTFWMMKWWRVREMADIGREWITGCANHDTLRRGSQTPVDARLNTNLGDTLTDMFFNAYDNPAAKLFDYAMMPGVPMDFINATMRAPWGFIRNTDNRYGVKVVSEEARFSEWLITPEAYDDETAFRRLKAIGFDMLPKLRRFVYALENAVQTTLYDIAAALNYGMIKTTRDDLVQIVGTLNHAIVPDLDLEPFTVDSLKAFARAWMDDVHEFCNVWHYTHNLDPARTAYNLKLRRFRQARPWLMDNLDDDEFLTYLYPTRGSVIYYGLRRSPDGREMVFFMANMEGQPRTFIPRDLLPPGVPLDGWQRALVTPGLPSGDASHSLTLADSQGAVFVRRV